MESAEKCRFCDNTNRQLLEITNTLKNTFEKCLGITLIGVFGSKICPHCCTLMENFQEFKDAAVKREAIRGNERDEAMHVNKKVTNVCYSPRSPDSPRSPSYYPYYTFSPGSPASPSYMPVSPSNPYSNPCFPPLQTTLFSDTVAPSTLNAPESYVDSCRKRSFGDTSDPADTPTLTEPKKTKLEPLLVPSDDQILDTNYFIEQITNRIIALEGKETFEFFKMADIFYSEKWNAQKILYDCAAFVIVGVFGKSALDLKYLLSVFIVMRQMFPDIFYDNHFETCNVDGEFFKSTKQYKEQYDPQHDCPASFEGEAGFDFIVETCTKNFLSWITKKENSMIQHYTKKQSLTRIMKENVIRLCAIQSCELFRKTTVEGCYKKAVFTAIRKTFPKGFAKSDEQEFENWQNVYDEIHKIKLRLMS